MTVKVVELGLDRLGLILFRFYERREYEPWRYLNTQGSGPGEENWNRCHFEDYREGTISDLGSFKFIQKEAYPTTSPESCHALD